MRRLLWLLPTIAALGLTQCSDTTDERDGRSAGLEDSGGEASLDAVDVDAPSAGSIRLSGAGPTALTSVFRSPNYTMTGRVVFLPLKASSTRFELFGGF